MMQGIQNLNRLYALARGLLAVVGLAAVLAVALPSSRDTLLQQAAALVNAAEAAAGTVSAAARSRSRGGRPRSPRSASSAR